MIPDDDLGHDPHRGAPRKASQRELAERLNTMATALNFLSEQISEIRHALGYREPLSIRRRKIDPREGRL